MIKLDKGEKALYIGSRPEVNCYTHMLPYVEADTYVLSDLMFDEEFIHEIDDKKVITTNKDGLLCLDGSVKFILFDQAVSGYFETCVKILIGTYIKHWLVNEGVLGVRNLFQKSLGFELVDENKIIYQKVEDTSITGIVKARNINKAFDHTMGIRPYEGYTIDEFLDGFKFNEDEKDILKRGHTAVNEFYEQLNSNQRKLPKKQQKKMLKRSNKNIKKLLKQSKKPKKA